MEGRPDRMPGIVKQEPNRVGAIQFVAPTLVEGTLREGFRFYNRLTYPFARAVFQTFLVAGCTHSTTATAASPAS